MLIKTFSDQNINSQLLVWLHSVDGLTCPTGVWISSNSSVSSLSQPQHGFAQLLRTSSGRFLLRWPVSPRSLRYSDAGLLKGSLQMPAEAEGAKESFRGAEGAKESFRGAEEGDPPRSCGGSCGGSSMQRTPLLPGFRPGRWARTYGNHRERPRDRVVRRDCAGRRCIARELGVLSHCLPS
ncbi:zinc-finger homeodomain protein 3 [Phtheirospermum japonicum]|uniref:Zinc-finger homeodomain protein 3 n=1 Tax=Phtheirospermum japonicum TaxID=374723 RepID=A0A830CRK8_9LAMI|nr:zinc-finger homeodomain protein 3 [Phtheirospermum japonicum]